MVSTLTVSPKAAPFPFAVIAISAYTQKAEVIYDESASTLTLELDGSKSTSEQDAVKALATAGGLAEDSAKTPAYFTLASSLAAQASVPEIMSALNLLDDYLAYRTYLVGHDITSADWMVWGALKGNIKIIGLLKNNLHQHLNRWFTHLESLECTQAALAGLAEAKATKARSNQKTASSFAMGLQGAKQGQVVTRFPPEPSGYLHIGHTKAAILNQYFAQMYNGKLLIRFDDTNPSKERTEFEETILEDLSLLEITGDSISHTSDYFDKLYELAIQIIKDGKAYADDTEQTQMRQERWDGIASKNRDATVEQNLARFEEMKKGTEEGLRWCIRAKISVDDPNKAMRDPVIYRCNLLPHHRTGDKWKIYPTYDFACPVVDSIEGVTHALRTNEYRDRNPQYHWMISALGIRPVNIWDFSRLNFIYTLLSKRKLHWFVDQGYVRGWDDPRFPTVRGIRRRGMTVEALKQFMLAQGPSQAIVSHEWDSIWALNKKVIDPIAPRFWAVLKTKPVPVTINGGPSTPEVKTLPKHKKNPDVGEKQTVYSSSLLLEQEDALSFDDNEEVTLMDWGNAIVRSKTTDASGAVTSLTMDLNLAGDFRKTKKKITWLSQPTSDSPPEHQLTPAVLIDFDYIITKKKLEDGDEVKDFVTPVTEFREEAWADPNVRLVKKGEVIQFERKGYYIMDGVVDGVWEFIHIPDGRAAGLASKAATSAAAAPAKTQTAVEEKKADILETPVETKMYKMDRVYGQDKPVTEEATKMYKMKNMYDV